MQIPIGRTKFELLRLKHGSSLDADPYCDDDFVR
jgi:hypothetical protein